MTRSDVLRDLYEALEMLDARQIGAGGRTANPPRAVVVDLRDPDGGVVAGTLRHEVRTALGADWDQGFYRW